MKIPHQSLSDTGRELLHDAINVVGFHCILLLMQECCSEMIGQTNNENLKYYYKQVRGAIANAEMIEKRVREHVENLDALE